jgi:phosphatidylglycerophosphate synthase
MPLAPLTLETSSALVRAMRSVATQHPVRPASLPIVLTYLRILAVPAVVLCLVLIKGDAGRWWALGVYIAACITDWLDGYLARVWHQQSILGRMLDPIADKLLVGTTLLMLTYDNTIEGAWALRSSFCAAIPVSGSREFLAEPMRVRAAARKVEDDDADDRARHLAGRAGGRQDRVG